MIFTEAFMTTFDRVKELADSQKISIAEIEEKLGFGRNSLYSWKKKIPNGASLEKVADYFGVSVDYLLGRTNNKYYGLSGEKRELSIEQALNSVMSYDGKPMTDNDRDILRGIIEAYMDKKQV